MSYIGHTDARRHLTATGWEYESPANQSFAEGLQFFGLSLPDVDAYIETLEAAGDPHAAKVRVNRTHALKERQNLDFSMRYLEAVLMHKRDRDAAAEVRRQKAEKHEAWAASAAQAAEKATNAQPPAPVPVDDQRQRSDLMVAPIRLALNSAKNPSDASEVFAILRAMAESKHPPMLGISDEGIKWLDAKDETKFLNLTSLRKRLSRMTPKA